MFFREVSLLAIIIDGRFQGSDTGCFRLVIGEDHVCSQSEIVILDCDPISAQQILSKGWTTNEHLRLC